MRAEGVSRLRLGLSQFLHVEQFAVIFMAEELHTSSYSAAELAVIERVHADFGCVETFSAFNERPPQRFAQLGYFAHKAIIE